MYGPVFAFFFLKIWKRMRDDWINLKEWIYVRVSTEEQRDYGYSIDGQLRELKDYCKRQNYVIVDIYMMRGIVPKI